MVKLIRDSKYAFFSHASGSVQDPQKFWHIMKSLKSTSTNSLPDLSLVNGSVVATADHEKAEALNQYFCECFNTVIPP